MSGWSLSSIAGSVSEMVGVNTDTIDTKAVGGVLSTLTKNFTQAKDSILATPKIEILIREATNDDQCPPTNTQKQEIAQASHYYAEFPIIMEWLWNRINEPPHNWRRVYKALLVIDYLLKSGSDQVERDVQVHRTTIERLQRFRYLDENDRDVGANIRERAKQVVALLRDPELLREEKKKSRQNKSKYMESMSSDSYYPGGGSGGGGGGGYRGGGGGSGGYRGGSSEYHSRQQPDSYSTGRSSPSWDRRDDSYNRHHEDRYSESESDEPEPEPEPVATVTTGIGLIDFGDSTASPPPTTTATTGSSGFNIFLGTTNPTVSNPSLFPPPPTGGASTIAPTPGSLFPIGTAPTPSISSTMPTASDDFFDPRGGAHSTTTTPVTSAPSTLLGGSTMPPRGGAPLIAPAEDEWGNFVEYDKQAAEKKNDLWNKHQGLIDLGHLTSPTSTTPTGSAPGYKQAIGSMPTAKHTPTMGSLTPTGVLAPTTVGYPTPNVYGNPPPPTGGMYGHHVAPPMGARVPPSSGAAYGYTHPPAGVHTGSSLI